MPVTVVGRTLQMTANTDIVNWATMQSTTPPGGPYKIRVNAIHFVTGAATGATTLKNGGTSGVTFWSGSPTINTTTTIAFSEPQEFDDLACTAIGTNVNVVLLFV